MGEPKQSRLALPASLAVVSHWGRSLEALGREALARVLARRVVGLASESAFWLSLAFVPLAAISTLAVARLALRGGVQVAPLLHSIPPGAREWIATQLDDATAYRSGHAAPAATVTFIWLASSGVHGLFDAFEVCAAVVERPWWKKRLVSIGYCVVLALGMGIIGLVGSGLDRFIQVLGGSAQAIGTAESMLRSALSVAVDFCLTFGLYRFGMKQTDRIPILPATLSAVTLQALLGWAYAAFVRRLGDSSEYLAGIAAFIVTMTAVFLYSLSLLLGIVLSGVLHDRAATRARLARGLSPAARG
ncbi:MAG: YhjD/YihY/BrkB family envelope integrity protein [Polyangiaceae bacterium]